MSAYDVDPAIDPLRPSDLHDLAALEGRCVSLLMNTHRSGPATRTGGDRLRRLMSLIAEYVDAEPADFLAPVESLAADDHFWQHQSEGLAVYAVPSGLLRFRLPVPVADEAAVGVPRLRPLVPALTSGITVLVLALSSRRVRLFEATPWTMTEMALGPIPSSVDESEPDRDLQQSLQSSAQGGGDQNFHGHGGDANAQRAVTERFFRAVAHGLAGRVGLNSAPVVLACVPENRALFECVGGHPRLVKEIVPGNADRTPPATLHRQVREIAADLIPDADRPQLGRWTSLTGTGRLLHDLRAVVDAAGQGRVEAVLVAPEPSTDGTPRLVQDAVDLAIRSTLRHGGRVHALPDIPALASGDGITAVLRW
jgi:hypothetical protein